MVVFSESVRQGDGSVPEMACRQLTLSWSLKPPTDKISAGWRAATKRRLARELENFAPAFEYVQMDTVRGAEERVFQCLFQT